MGGGIMLRCDFCGRETETLRRVVLDKGYDRLTLRHEKRYACEACSAKKEDERRVREAKEGASRQV
jgi:hypothetical protein